MKKTATKKKVVAKKKVVVEKPTVELVSYTLRAVIPTGAYANIQPEITVNASTLQEAEEVLMDHFVKLNEKYLNFNDKPKVVTPKPVVEVVPTPKNKITVDNTHAADLSVPMTRATNAVKTAYSQEALLQIREQVEKSSKLTEDEKVKVLVYIVDRGVEIENKEANKKG